jgi:hypothetical protein
MILLSIYQTILRKKLHYAIFYREAIIPRNNLVGVLVKNFFQQRGWTLYANFGGSSAAPMTQRTVSAK